MTVLSIQRALFASAACAMLLIGAIAVFSTRTPAGAQGGPEKGLIGILDTGFNPTVCRLNRNGDATFRWINRGSEPHHVRSKATDILGEPQFDTGVLQPGQSSRSYVFNGGSKFDYFDVLNPELTGQVDIGLHGDVCQELPPTPTPTNTPTITPTPTKTLVPTVTPTQAPPTPDLRKAIIPMIARDED